MQSKYYGLLLFTSFLWGGNFVAGKFLVNHASPLFLTELRWVIALFCLIPIVLYFDGSLRFPKAALIPLIFMGFTGVLLFNVLMFIALTHTTADNVGLLSTLNPISIAIASFCFYREKLSKLQLTGMFISFAGIFVVISHGDINRLINFHFNIGDLFMIGAVAIWGLYSVIAKKAMNYVSPYKATLWSAIFGVIMIFPFIINDHTISSPTPSFWIATIYSSVGATVLAMIFWNIGVQKVGGTKSGMFLNFNPIFTAILAFLFLGEKLTFTQFIGSIIVILGVYIFTAQKKAFLKLPNSKARAH